MNTEAIKPENIKDFFSTYYHDLNAAIYKVQRVIAQVYSKYFTMYAALLFAGAAGACLGFTGDDCYGKIPFNSPLFWCLALVVTFFFLQTFLMIALTIGRIARLLVVGVCGHYLSYQAYGFWSIKNVVDLAEVFSGTDVCRPYAYANIAYGHFWLNVPALALIGICFFSWNKKTEFDE